MVMLSGRPLLSTTRDRPWVVDRPAELGLLTDAVARRLNVLLYGTRGSGVTTTLHQLMRRLMRADLAHPRFVNAAAIGSADELVHEVAGDLVPTVAAVDTAATYSRFSRYADLPTGVVALVDNAPVRLIHETFGVLRDEVWSLPLSWVITCSDTDRAAVLTPPSDAFFDVVVEMAPLTDVEAASLLRRRATKDELAPSAMLAAVAAGEGNPRALIQAARRLVVDHAEPSDVLSAAQSRREMEHRLSRPAMMLLRELESRGPSSASDAVLQDAMGWTRSRLVQVLAELSELGAVEDVDVHDGRAGRPRRVYRSRFTPESHG